MGVRCLARRYVSRRSAKNPDIGSRTFPAKGEAKSVAKRESILRPHPNRSSMEERFGWGRRMLSRFATLLASPFAGKVRDPMSGFFALRRETYLRAKHLTPI